MGRGYRRFSAADEDEIWARLRAGHAAKPTARALGLTAGGVRAYLVRCGGIRPAPRRRAPGRLSLAEREEISRGLAAGLSLRAIAAGLGRAPSTVSREVAAQGGRRGYRAASADQLAWARARRPQPCKLATRPALRANRGREAPAGAVVTGADRWLVEGHLPRRPGDAGVARDDLPHPVHPVPWCAAPGADRASADRAGDSPPGGNPAPGWPWWPARDPQHLRTPRRGQTTERYPGTGKATWSSANA